jgi:transposase
VSVNEISIDLIKDRAVEKGDVGTCVGLDVAKHEIVVCLRWADGTYERPWNVKNPDEIGVLVSLLVQLNEISGSLVIGLESTGNYSESIRRAMTESFLAVHRVSGKSVSDYKEIFDGVPSQHDGKDAAMIAELTAFGKGTEWPFSPLSELDQTIKHQVVRLDAFRLQANQWLCRLEGLLARHWPEASSLLALSSKTLLQIAIHYGSPSRLAADPEAATRLRGWGRGALKDAKIEAVIEAARTSYGIPMGQGESAWLIEVATEALAALREVKACENRLKKFAEEHEELQKYAKSVGAATLCVLWTCVGDPRKYSSSGAYLKALGLNLKELSSGKRRGELAITKRGPSLARKWLYFWALRAVQTRELKGWYQAFHQVGRPCSPSHHNSEHRKMKGLIAMMRKLCRSLWYVWKHDLEFDYGKVFPGKPLNAQTARRKTETQEPANA